MEQWILYGIVAAVFIACRDIFTRHFTKKYTTTEHILYYYILCSVVIIGFVAYKKTCTSEKIRCIDWEDLWKYALLALLSVLIISPCQTLSLKTCQNTGQSKAVISLNIVVVFFLGILFLKDKFSLQKFGGILLTLAGIYFVI